MWENESNIVKMKNSLTEQLRITENIMTTIVDIIFKLLYNITLYMYEVNIRLVSRECEVF